jgi:hypothetical protein
MATNERIGRQDHVSAVNSAVGGLLSWVTGKGGAKDKRA